MFWVGRSFQARAAQTQKEQFPARPPEGDVAQRQGGTAKGGGRDSINNQERSSSSNQKAPSAFWQKEQSVVHSPRRGDAAQRQGGLR